MSTGINGTQNQYWLNLDDLTPIEIKLRLGGEEYILREASEGAVCQFKNALMRCTKMNSDGKVSFIENAADVEPFLVSLCLFKVTEKGPIPVPLITIKAWTSRVVKPLFDKAKEISNLDDTKDTPDTLLDKITKLQEQRDKLMAGQEGNAPSPADTIST